MTGTHGESWEFHIRPSPMRITSIFSLILTGLLSWQTKIKLNCQIGLFFLVLTPYRSGQQTPSYQINEDETPSPILGLSLFLS
jgi:hypothetical protein